MPRERLRVFVSGKEGELGNERAIAIKVITELYFEPLASENRTASEQPIKDEYIGEVIDADIYVGIFSKEYSEPSKNEFDTARANNIPVLVFEKQLNNDERNVELKAFLKQVKNPASGVTTDKYTNVIDFEESLKKALSVLISRKFKNTRELEKSKILEELYIEEVQKVAPESRSTEQSKTVFTTIKFPSEITRGSSADISAEIKGSTTNAFLDLLLVAPDGRQKYYPDPKSWNSALDKGILQLKNDMYASTWQFNIKENYKPGKYKATICVFEDTETQPKSRRLIASEDKEFEVL